VGEVYKEDEENIDWDNTISCGRGLHVASRRYDYSGFGDVAVMVIVNPSKIRSVPIGSADIGKMRVSEMYIASVLEIDEKGQYIDEHLDIVDMDEKYFNISVAEMENNLKTLDTTKLNGILTFSSLVNISKNLKTESDKTIKAMEKRIKFV